MEEDRVEVKRDKKKSPIEFFRDHKLVLFCLKFLSDFDLHA